MPVLVVLTRNPHPNLSSSHFSGLISLSSLESISSPLFVFIPHRVSHPQLHEQQKQKQQVDKRLQLCDDLVASDCLCCLLVDQRRIFTADLQPFSTLLTFQHSILSDTLFRYCPRIIQRHCRSQLTCVRLPQSATIFSISGIFRNTRPRGFFDIEHHLTQSTPRDI
jgi:hypothetical protein